MGETMARLFIFAGRHQASFALVRRDSEMQPR